MTSQYHECHHASTIVVESQELAEIRRKLSSWFAQNRRALPWRERYEPYAVWVSEMMLQQTQVKTMLPYYLRWMERFPDLRAVAAAQESEVLKLWEGLGYYSRARSLRKAAMVMVEKHACRVPEDFDVLRSLPGVGPYTAAAVMSVAFNRDFPVVDGNVRRVLARLFDVGCPVGTGEGARLVLDLAERLLPGGDARNFNQALMELGALVCSPRNPLCTACPVERECASLGAGTVLERPVKVAAKRVVPIEVAVGVLVRSGRVLIQKRPPTGLMANLWEFPGGKVEEGETPREALIREFREELEVDVTCGRKITAIRHAYTSFRVLLHAYWCHMAGGQVPVPRSSTAVLWAKGTELGEFAFPAANRKLIGLILHELSAEPGARPGDGAFGK